MAADSKAFKVVQTGRGTPEEQYIVEVSDLAGTRVLRGDRHVCRGVSMWRAHLCTPRAPGSMQLWVGSLGDEGMDGWKHGWRDVLQEEEQHMAMGVHL